MARGINKVTLLGHLGSDPERRETTTGKSVVNFSLATSETYKDANGEKQEKTEWHRIVVWGKLADICSRFLRKGSLIYLEGKLQTRSWEQDGVKKYSTEINASEMQMLDRKPTDAEPDTERRTYKVGDPIPAPPPAPTAWRQQPPDRDDLPF